MPADGQSNPLSPDDHLGLRPAARPPREPPGGSAAGYRDSALPSGGEPFPGELQPGDELAVRQVRRRRLMVLAIIAVVIAAAVVAVIAWRRSGHTAPGPAGAELLTEDQRIREERQLILDRAQGPEDQHLLRIALGGGAGPEQRIEAMTRLAEGTPRSWSAEALGWMVRNDAAMDVRLAAVDRLGKLDSASSRGALVRAVGARLPGEVDAVVVEVLVRQRDVQTVRQLLGLLVNRDPAVVSHGAEVVRKITGLEQRPWPPRTEAECLAYAALVHRWADAGGPPPGTVWPAVPSVDTILIMSGDGPGSPRETFELGLVDQAVKGHAEAWSRLVELVMQEPSIGIRSKLADRLATEDGPESVLLQVLLVDRVDAATTGKVMAGLARLRGTATAAPSTGSGQAAPGAASRVAGVFAAGPLRRWFREAHADLAARHAELLKDRGEQETFEAAAALLARTDEKSRPAEAATVSAEVRRGNVTAAGLLVMLLRDGLGSPAREEAMKALAAVGSRQAWFFLVDELPRSEHLTHETEAALHGATFKDRLPPWPTYGSTTVDRRLAWQFALRFGLAHLDKLPDLPLLRAREVPSAALPVVVPDHPRNSAAEATQEVLMLYGRLSAEDRAAVMARLPDYAAAGDEVAAALQRLLSKGR